MMLSVSLCRAEDGIPEWKEDTGNNRNQPASLFITAAACLGLNTHIMNVHVAAITSVVRDTKHALKPSKTPLVLPIMPVSSLLPLWASVILCTRAQLRAASSVYRPTDSI